MQCTRSTSREDIQSSRPILTDLRMPVNNLESIHYRNAAITSQHLALDSDHCARSQWLVGTGKKRKKGQR